MGIFYEELLAERLGLKARMLARMPWPLRLACVEVDEFYRRRGGWHG